MKTTYPKTLEELIEQDRQLKETLEAAIDQRGVSDVLCYIRDICNEKGRHVEENWQDEKLAQQWFKRGKTLLKAIVSIAFLD